MKITHEIKQIDGIDQIVLNVEYPDEYEFSLDFDKIKKNVANVSEKIRDYALKNISSISDNTVLLILNGVVIGTLLVSQLTVPKDSPTIDSGTEIVETLPNENEDNGQKEEQIQAMKAENIEEEKNTEDTAKASTDIPPETKSVQKPTTNTSPPKNNASTPSTPAPSNPGNSNSGSGSVIPSQMIKVQLATGSVISISLEDYIIGVVSSEMPASFHVEALKAQSVAARTYALKKTGSGATISATKSDQVYKTNEQLKAQWGSSYNTYYNKVKSAVLATKGDVMTYNGAYIDAVYSSTSNGKTEDPVHVWGNSLPYLKSVNSPWDLNVKGFSQTKTISMSQISSKLGVSLTSVSQIKINSRTTGDRVKSVTIAGKEFTGVKVRTALGLRSADFSVSASGSDIVFTTKGYGHGVGMSQYGANGMANAGNSYTQILKHYYTGININKK